MQLISDLHLHSRYSRACSKDLSIKTLEKYAGIKGVNLLGTSDFAHPEWIKELKSELTEDGTGILKTKPKIDSTIDQSKAHNPFPFILSNELSLMYTDLGKGRKVHNVLLAPNFEVVDQITDELKKRGRIDYDGRPIFKIPCPEFVEMLHSISKDIEIIPAHIWTPHFGMFGSSSGFDSLKDAFQEKTKSIHAIETGLSSDPQMNWRIKELDKISLLSFSDSHSYWPWRLGREATLFDFKHMKNIDINSNDKNAISDYNEAIAKLTYKDILKAIRTREGLHGTVEVDPGYGKYHVDGHRNCNISMEPNETLKHKGICPKCGKPLTIGVLYRVEQLADKERPENYKPNPNKQDNVKDFKTLIPLSEILSAVLGRAVATKTVNEEYYRIIKDTNEYNVLLNLSKKELLKRTNDKITDAILKNREGKLKVIPGYDGVYGQLVLR
ncbi:DNA helicase UvrD [Candidatus Woesearchaeota archaeon]|jgi:uncharacterized protein (TIGR00375 family)|nr:DNA helicase UvrD [Candidatus Woesearchaeota archaeon]